MKQWVQGLFFLSDWVRPGHLAAIAYSRPRLMALLASPYYRNILDVSPGLRRQHLTTYLVRSFNARERHVAAFHHYKSVKELLKPEFTAGLLGSGVPIWGRTFEDDSFRIVVRQNKEHFYEGDILLVLYREDQRLFQVSFSIVPGVELGMQDGNVLLIGGAQGGKAESEDLKRAIKGNAGVAPSHLVMAAVRGVAHALGIHAMAGVCNAEQLVKTQDDHEPFSFDYDAFWPMFGGTANDRGVFVLPTEPFEKPLLDIPRTHRRRSRKKREFKAEVTMGVENGLSGYLRAPATAPESKPGLPPERTRAAFPRLHAAAIACAPVLALSGDVGALVP